MRRNVIVSANVDGCRRVASQQRVQPDASHFGVLLEMDHVLCQAGERDLGFEDVLLRHFADGVLDPGRFNRLARNGNVPVMDAQLILCSQQIVERLAHTNANLEPCVSNAVLASVASV